MRTLPLREIATSASSSSYESLPGQATKISGLTPTTSGQVQIGANYMTNQGGSGSTSEVITINAGYAHQAFTLSGEGNVNLIGIGMWLALFMAFNVWFIIWPNQQKALGLVDVPADQKAPAARLAGMTSRINTMLSIPMLFCMVAQQNGGL